MSLTAVLFFGLAWLGANLLGSNFISPYFSQGGGLLGFHLLALVGSAIFFWLSQLHGPIAQRRRFWFVVGWVVIFVGSAWFRQLGLRLPDSQPIGIHDGAIHMEVAAEKLLQGENPYSADYRGTNYQNLNPPIAGGPAINVVWSHYIYPPASFLVLVPWTWLGQVMGGVADVRWLALGALGLVSWLLIRTQRSWNAKTLVLLLTAGNPIVWLYVIAGYNDVLMTAALIATAWSLRHSRWTAAGIWFGLALGLKQSAWLALPLFIWWLVRLWHQRPADGKKLGAATLATLAIIFLPFVIWNTPALYDDIIRYASGSIPFSYPISGATFLQYLRIWGWIDSPWAIVPAAWLQLLVGIPLVVAVGRKLNRQLDATSWLTGVIIVTMGILLVSRYNNNNYVSGLFLLAVAAYAFRADTKPAIS